MPDLTSQIFNPQPTVQAPEGAYSPDLKYAMEEIFSNDNLEMKTDLTQKQINAMTKGLLFAKEFKNNLMRDLVNKMMRLLVSKGRKGRAEFIQMTQQINNQAPQQNEGIAKRLLGL